MKINKGPMHAKITGDFGEALVLYWLSKYGFECASFDHTGIDIIARNRLTKEVIGVSVKSRSRNEGSEDDSISIPNDNFAKAEVVCAAFGWVPYFAIVVDAGDTLRVFILPMGHLLAMFPKGKTTAEWKMTKPYIEKYAVDPLIQTFEFHTETIKWWSQQTAA